MTSYVNGLYIQASNERRVDVWWVVDVRGCRPEVGHSIQEVMLKLEGEREHDPPWGEKIIPA